MKTLVYPYTGRKEPILGDGYVPSTDMPTHIPLNVKWEDKEKQELAEYYWYMADKSTNRDETLFFLRGYMSLLGIELSIEEVAREVIQRIKFSKSMGYTYNDIARHCGISRYSIYNMKDYGDIPVNKYPKEIIDSFFYTLFKLEPKKIKSK